jgi:hypothetical protein
MPTWSPIKLRAKDWLRFFSPCLRRAIGLLMLAALAAPATAQEPAKKSRGAPVRAPNPAASDAEVSKLRAEVIRTTKESRESLLKLLAVYERDLHRQTQDLELKRELFEQEFISRLELEETEKAVAQLQANIKQVRRWILEDDIALTEALFEQELAKLAPLPPGGYTVTNTLIRYNGHAPWSLADAGKIEQYFMNLFGRALPVSAFGQSLVHDRMKFDHRDAMDVALHPDSPEGRALMEYLRKSGIPFIAFRGRVAGSATGAHIHIGKPSLRSAQK